MLATEALKASETLAKHFRQGGTFCVRLPPLPAVAHLALDLAAELERPVVWVTDGPRTLDIFFQDLCTLRGIQKPGTSNQPPLYYPPWESLPGHGAMPSADLTGDRLAVLAQLARGATPPILATCVQALMQRTLAPSLFLEQSIVIRRGSNAERDSLMERLVHAGYSVQAEVQAKGQAAVRGGIVDAWPPTSPWPVRIELFGDVVESLRMFDPALQTSLDDQDEAHIGPACEAPDQLTATLFDYLFPSTLDTRHVPLLAWVDEDGIRQHAELYGEVIREAHAEAVTVPFASVFPSTPGTRPALHFAVTGEVELPYEPVEALPSLARSALQPDLVEKTRSEFLAGVFEKARAGWDARVCFATTGARERFTESAGAHAQLVHVHVGALSEGFSCPARKLLVLAESDLYGRRKEHRGRYDLHGAKSD
ncbi:MAG TPA: hypothetical protein VIH35_04330, partial [Kiritimatiellia bacterium]